jgi:hypothetical protein
MATGRPQCPELPLIFAVTVEHRFQAPQGDSFARQEVRDKCDTVPIHHGHRLIHHCHIVETGNGSYRLQNSSLATQTKIKSRERKRKDGIEDDEPF